jgi:hypothetical protein
MRNVYRFSVRETTEKTSSSGGVVVNLTIILKWILKLNTRVGAVLNDFIVCESVEWINLAQYRDH